MIYNLHYDYVIEIVKVNPMSSINIILFSVYTDYWWYLTVYLLSFHDDFLYTCVLLKSVQWGKRCFKIDQHLALRFVDYVECLSRHPPFLCSQIIIPFLKFSANHDKG